MSMNTASARQPLVVKFRLASSSRVRVLVSSRQVHQVQRLQHRTSGRHVRCLRQIAKCHATASNNPQLVSWANTHVYVPASPLAVRLEQCQTAEEIMQLYLSSKQLTASDVAAVFKQLYTLHGFLSTRKRNMMGQMMEPLMHDSQPMLRYMAADELVVVVRTVARLQPRLHTRWVLLMLVSLRTKLGSLAPRQLMRGAQGLAQLPLDWQEHHEQLHSFLGGFAQACWPKLGMFKTDELTLLICALADLGYKPQQDWMAELCRISLGKMDSFQTHFLARMLAAFAKLGYRPDSQWVAAYYHHLRQQLPLFDASDLATTVLAVAEHQRLNQPGTLQELMGEIDAKLNSLDSWALGRLVKALVYLRRVPDAAFMAKLEAKLHATLHQFKSWVLAEVVWGLGQLRYRPSPAFLQEAVLATGRSLALGRTTNRFMHPTPFVQLLLGFASLQQPLPWDWLEDYAYLAQRRITHPSHICQVLHGFSEVGFRPPTHLLHAWVGTLSSTEELELLDPEQQYHLLYSLARIGYTPSQEWLRKFCIASFRTRLGFRPHPPAAEALANTFWSMGVLGYQPPADWLNDGMVAAQCQPHNFRPVHLARMLWALRRMHYQPSARWLSIMCDRMEQVLGGFQPGELAECVVALAAFGFRPRGSWLGAVAGAVGRLQGGLTQELLQQVGEAISTLHSRVCEEAVQPPQPSQPLLPLGPAASDQQGTQSQATQQLQQSANELQWQQLPAAQQLQQTATDYQGAQSQAPQQLQQTANDHRGVQPQTPQQLQQTANDHQR